MYTMLYKKSGCLKFNKINLQVHILIVQYLLLKLYIIVI